MSVDGISLADNRVRRKTAVRNVADAELKIVFTYALLLPAFVDASHIRVVAYRDATERAFGPEIDYAQLKRFRLLAG